MTEIQNNLFGIKWPTGVDMLLNKTQTQTFLNEIGVSLRWEPSGPALFFVVLFENNDMMLYISQKPRNKTDSTL